MHSSANIDDMKQEINSKGHNVANTCDTKPLSMFYIELKPPITKKYSINSINYLLQCKIKFEQPYSKRKIPQCIKCQRNAVILRTSIIVK